MRGCVPRTIQTKHAVWEREIQEPQEVAQPIRAVMVRADWRENSVMSKKTVGEVGSLGVPTLIIALADLAILNAFLSWKCWVRLVLCLSLSLLFLAASFNYGCLSLLGCQVAGGVLLPHSGVCISR